MKLASCIYQDQPRVAVVIEAWVLMPSLLEIWPFGSEDMLNVIAQGEPALNYLRSMIDSRASECRVPLDHVEFLAPIPRPRKNVICLGWNYAEHARESAEAFKRDLKLPQDPVVFTKAVTAVNGPYSPIPYDPDVCSELDWEVELGVVIGRGGRKISRKAALTHVFGYTIVNDLSARDLQRRHQQFFLGKSLDGTCPMGPVIVTSDEIPDPQRLRLRCRVNGEIKQDSDTRHQIFDVASTISILSKGMTLEPGDIISTGTPSGVGFARHPPEFLKPGDRVECEIEGIGSIENRIVATTNG